MLGALLVLLFRGWRSGREGGEPDLDASRAVVTHEDVLPSGSVLDRGLFEGLVDLSDPAANRSKGKLDGYAAGLLLCLSDDSELLAHYVRPPTIVTRDMRG